MEWEVVFLLIVSIVVSAVCCFGHAYYLTVMSVKTSNDLGSENSITEFSSAGFELIHFDNDADGGTHFEIPEWAKSEDEKRQETALNETAKEGDKMKSAWSGRWTCANCGSINPGSVYVCTCGNMKSSNTASSGEKKDSLGYYEEVKF
ncbi:MAG: hypothetical protein K6F31_07865 [Acetatifactor sp.]|nr:hypothetical protein [Acetatifactor sp.]